MTQPRAVKLKKQEKRWRTLPTGSYRDSTRSMLRALLKRKPDGEPLELISDGHPAYRSAVADQENGSIRHQVFANPERGEKGSSRSDEAKQRDFAMFPVDMLHRLIRHSNANHKRETIAFGRRANAIMLRGFHFLVWRNYVKDLSERSPTRKTAAMKVGATDRMWRWSVVLSQRLFPWRQAVPKRRMKLYRQRMKTPAVGKNEVHDLVNAF